MCGKDCYQSGMWEPYWQFITIPLGLVIQVLYGSPETAHKMHYCERATGEILEYAQMHGGKVKEYNNMTCSCDYLEAIEAGRIKDHDVLMQLSLNGAQLYHNKDSDC